MPNLFRLIQSDVRRKADWCYQSHSPKAVLKTLLTDGTTAMILYRLMQWSTRRRLSPLAMVFNKANAFFGNCIIGRGADFGPGFVLIHSTGVVINSSVRGGSNILIEHQVTIGAEGRSSPVLGDDIFIGAGAKIIGDLTVGTGAKIGANSVVLDDVPEHSTMVGVAARVVRRRNVDADAPADRPAEKLAEIAVSFSSQQSAVADVMQEAEVGVQI